MQVIIEKSVLDSLINQAISFTERKDQTQITSHFLLQATDKLTIKATDKEIGITITTDAKILNPGVTTINARRFADIIKTLKNKEIEIKTQEDKVIITQDSSIYKLSSFNHQEFPQFPDTQKNKLSIDPEVFHKAIKKIFPVIDTNNPKYELNGALFDIKENTNFVSTDTRRLAVYKTQASGNQSQIIVPKRAISEIKRIFREDMEILYDETFLILKDENILFFTKLINGKFPAYEKIIPQSFKYEIELNKSEFLSHLKQVSIIANEVRITISKERIAFESISDENMQAKTDYSIQNETEIDDFTFAVNSKYLMDFLNVVDKETFTLCLNEPNIPFMVKEDDFITIIMPLNI
ncbi:MAG: DNA polymerase III subunit beta [Epsilonproteobacteria bacterium]|nr:DNA polymerase III subunit beta [Campylobacterota bacterium]